MMVVFVGSSYNISNKKIINIKPLNNMSIRLNVDFVLNYSSDFGIYFSGWVSAQNTFKTGIY